MEYIKPDWQVQKTFSREVGRCTLVVEVCRDVNAPWPKFTIHPGKQGAERVSGFVPIYSNRDGNRERKTIDTITPLCELMYQAKEWVDDKIAEMDIAYDAHRDNRDVEHKRTKPAVLLSKPEVERLKRTRNART